MQLNEIGTIIAERLLNHSDGFDIRIVLGMPEPFPDSRDFYCPYQILGLGTGRVRYSMGVDRLQALELALKMIGADLYTSSEAQAKKLTWNGRNNLGFPVPDGLQDLLPP